MWSQRQIMFDKNICRLCGLTCKKLLSFQYENASNESNSIWQLIKRWVPLKIDFLDQKPQQVCYECIGTLEKFNSFISNCMTNNSNFDAILEIVTSAQNNNITQPGIFSLDDRFRAGNQNSENIFMNKVNENSELQNDNLFIILELNCKKSNLDTVVVNEENQTSKENEDYTQISGLQENAIAEKVENPGAKKYDSNKKPFKCYICGRCLTRKSNLVAHMALHSNKRPHKCDECDKQFALSTDLTLHKNIHSQSFACKHCNKCFVTKSKLERHEKLHSGIKEHACPICKKRFAEKTNMITHISVHTGERPYSCSVCKKSFRIQSHLTDHGKVHSRVSPYRCFTCNKAFKWKSNLKDHMKYHSGEKFKCSDCHSEFPNRTDYYKHRKACRKLKEQVQMNNEITHILK